jgi:hypothetical protein
MSYSHSIPPTVQIRRAQLVGLVVAVAALAATVTWAMSSFAFDDGTSSTGSQLRTSTPALSSDARDARGVLTPAQLHRTSTLASLAWVPSAAMTDPLRSLSPAQVAALASIGMQPSRYFDLVMSLTPAQLPAGALGTGYAPPTEQGGLTVESVLASMSPQTRHYTERIMNLTFEQLAAGAAGHP